MEEKDKKKTMTIDDLKSFIVEQIKGMTPEMIAEFKKDLATQDVRTIFPKSGDGMLESRNKSIVDTSYFYRKYATPDGRQVDGAEMGRIMTTHGGPWKRLSPEMELFAKCAAVNWDPAKIGAVDGALPLKEYNAAIKASEGTTVFATTDAGALVPIEFLATVIEFATAQSSLIPKVWRIPMTSLYMRIPRLAQSAGSYFGGITLYHPAEGIEKTETKPSMDYLSFEAKKLIGIIPLTDEVIADASINLINYLTGLFVRAFQYQIEYEIITGNGTTQMTGILTDAAINWVSRQTVGTVRYDDLINLESALDENFTDLTWLSRRATVNTLRKQKDTVGQPVYHDGFTTFLGAAMTPQLLGYPVIKTRNVPALGTAGDLILGDMGMYIWGLRQDMVIDTSKDVRFYYDETVLRFVMRMDGKPGISIAFAALDNVPES